MIFLNYIILGNTHISISIADTEHTLTLKSQGHVASNNQNGLVHFNGQDIMVLDHELLIDPLSAGGILYTMIFLNYII